MRKLSKILGLLLMISGILIGCSKEKGETGPEGPKGEQGLQGIPGRDGAVIHQGTGIPATNLGKEGDMYLNMASGILYGPKQGNDWGTPLDLRGDKGDKGDPGVSGAAGSKILSGIINPASGTGAIGDYYLNRNTGDLFGPKTAIGWGTAINLKGTANVVSSPILDITWTLTIPNYSYTYDVPTPYFNAIGETSLQNMLNKGGVLLCYMIIGTSHYPMPLILSDSANPYQYLMRSHSTNGFMLFANRLNGTSIAGQTGLITKFRFVLIPAGLQISATSGKKINRDELKNMNYQQMQELLE